MFQHLEELHNSVDQHFPNGLCMLQNQAWLDMQRCSEDWNAVLIEWKFDPYSFSFFAVTAFKK